MQRGGQAAFVDRGLGRQALASKIRYLHSTIRIGTVGAEHTTGGLGVGNSEWRVIMDCMYGTVQRMYGRKLIGIRHRAQPSLELLLELLLDLCRPLPSA